MKNTTKDAWDIWKEAHKLLDERENAGDMLKMFELSLEIVKKDLEEVKLYDKDNLYDYIKSFINYEAPSTSFIYLSEEITNIALDFDDEEQGDRVEEILRKNLLTYWYASESLKLFNREDYAFVYANICRDELEKHMDFYELLELIRNVENDEKALYSFLRKSSTEEISDYVQDLLKITDESEDLRYKCRSLMRDLKSCPKGGRDLWKMIRK